MTILRFLRLAIVCMAASLTAAHAAPIPVAILGIPAGGPAWNDDVASKLMSTGLFSKVDIFPIRAVTPSLGRLLAYKSVLVFTDGVEIANPIALGNNLADYVDAGGGVVTAVFANATTPIVGRFNIDDYWAIEPTGFNIFGEELTLGTTHEPNSPLLRGVQTFDGGSSSYHGQGFLNSHAVDIADWSNGTPLIVRRVINGVNRVDLNFLSAVQLRKVRILVGDNGWRGDHGERAGLRGNSRAVTIFATALFELIYIDSHSGVNHATYPIFPASYHLRGRLT